MGKEKLYTAPESAIRVHIGHPVDTPELHKIFARTGTSFGARHRYPVAESACHSEP